MTTFGEDIFSDWGCDSGFYHDPPTGWFQLPRKPDITNATLTAIATGMAIGALCYKYFTPPTLRHFYVTIGEFMQV